MMNREHASSRRIYLDNAATSWPKPESVYQATEKYQRESGAPIGRGTHRSTLTVSRSIESLRQQLKQLCNAPSDMQVVFGFNGTDVLNTAIHGVVRPGDHVVTTVTEHNSVLRPLATLEKRGLITLDIVLTDGTGLIDVATIKQSLQPKTRLVALSHASNVTGAIQPLEDIAALLEAHQAKLLVDAAQSLGHIPIDLSASQVDLFACSGHKGLFGPFGTGVLLLKEQVAQEMLAFKQGGTGGDSETRTQPETLPEKFETGSLNVVGLMGLKAGVEYVAEHGRRIRAHEIELIGQLCDSLQQLDGVQIHGPQAAEQRVGVCGFSIEGHDPHELAMVLDSAHEIEVRAGLQCAPAMHNQLGTTQAGGTVRVSVGPFNSTEHISALVEAVTEYLRIESTV